jgi:hypothetical protein
MRGSSQTHFGALPSRTIKCGALQNIGAAIVLVLRATVYAAQMIERTSDAVANCTSRSFRRVIARFKEASATRAGA